jgi:hypothetical protein
VSEASQAFDLFVYLVDGQGVVFGEGLEYGVVESGFSALENRDSSNIPIALPHTPITMARSRKLARKSLFTLIDMFLCGETPGKTFRRAETPLAENLSASPYLNEICIFVLKFKGWKPFRG